MLTPEPSHDPTAAQAEERGAALVLLPLAATLDYYALPGWLQEQTIVQCAPQAIAYLACALWAAHNSGLVSRFGLERQKFGRGVVVGLLTGLVLGSVNSYLILNASPRLGYDITFLRQTPHAQLPVFVMLPWFICGIALFVEFNFRGFLLGRLVALESTIWRFGPARRLSPLALLISAFVFAYDPFMTATFQHLHWIAAWDGLIWGTIWVYTRNLYATIVAHAIEVIVMYSAVRAALMS
jgi:membrane protease YdiL (CAAX protease family)